jgi:hypothetical protein
VSEVSCEVAKGSPGETGARPVRPEIT